MPKDLAQRAVSKFQMMQFPVAFCFVSAKILRTSMANDRHTYIHMNKNEIDPLEYHSALNSSGN